MFLISGCGVSLVCPQDHVMGWVDFILERGGVPIIRALSI
jgi:hypothetical protein